MKNLLLCFLLFATSYTSEAQSVYTGWFDNLNEAYQNSYYYTAYNTTLFPDSLVQALYGNGNSGVELDYVSTNGIGEVFDPKSPIYTHAIKQYNPYSVDSIGLAYIYNYVYEHGAAPDTLIFQYYSKSTGGIDTSFIPYNPNLFVNYDYKRNLGTRAISQYKYILGAKDATSGSVKYITVPTNGVSGINMKPNDLFAFTVSYRPGFVYQVGDTIDENWSTQPTNLHSHFRAIIANITTNTAESEQSLTVTKQVRYNKLPGWNGLYIPGTAWSNYNQILASGFYIHARTIKSDGGLDGFTSPVHPSFVNPSPYCGNETIHAIVNLTNYLGGSKLTSATISWTANNVRQKDYQWTGTISPGNSTTVTIGSFAFPSGYDSIKAWVSNPNGVKDSLPSNDTAVLNFYVNPLPTAHFTDASISSQLIEFTPDDQALSSYSWNFGDGTASSTATTPSHLYAKSGTFTASLLTRNQYRCGSFFDTTISIVKNSSIPISSEGPFDIYLFPNPFSNIIFVKYKIENSAHVKAELYDVLGNEVCSLIDKTQEPGEYQLAIDEEKYHLKPGIYLLKFTDGNQYASKRIVKL